jgi:HAMP domain-containing protein
VVGGTLAGKAYTFVSQPLRNNQTYSSKSLRNDRGAIIGYLIRGTPETAKSQLLQQSLSAEIGIGIGVLLLDVLIGIVLARQISNPIRRITAFAQEVSMGKLDSKIEQTFNNEIGELAVAFNRMKRSLIKAMNMLQAVHYDWGRELYEKGNLDGAIYQLRNALAVKPDCVECYTALARALADKGNSVGAVKQYRAAVLLRPEDPDIHFNLGVLLYNQGDRELGIEELNAALDIYRQKGQNAEVQKVEQFLGSINLQSP